MDMDKITGDVVKWFRKRNTMIGVFGIIIITLTLYADFSYWAEAIDVGEKEPFIPPVVNDGNVTGIEALFSSENITGTLDHGHRNRAFIDPFDSEGTTYHLYTVAVPENASKIHVTCDGDPGSQRADGGDRNDMDLYLFEPGQDPSDETTYESASLNPTIAEELIYEKQNMKVGDWVLRADCYTGVDVTYELVVEVYVLVPEDALNETVE